jgi:tungstate transport system ATP-binding protein
MTGPPVYRLRDVRKAFPPAFALHVRDLVVNRAEIVALLGPTGAGKTTLLRLLAALEAADHGDVEFLDHVARPGRLPLAARRRLTLVYQRSLLLSGSVRYNVEYGLRLRRVPDAASRANAEIERLGLQGIAAQPAHTLSGGQIQLVALARALAISPDVLLLDEPTANLDPARVALVEQAVASARAERGLTVVWTTHNLHQARRVADRAALLLNGSLVEVGPTAELFDNPQDPRTADFVQGRMIY